MKKLTEKEKAQLTDEEPAVLFHRSMLRRARKIVFLRSIYQYFIKNKGWILSLLFVLSIVRSSIWYAYFGVNILTYSNLQDIFISFADYFMSIIVIGILLICFYLITPQNIDNKCEKITEVIFLIIILIVLLWIILSLYRMIFSISTSILIFLTLFAFFKSKMKIALLYFSLLYLLALSLFQPMEQYFHFRGGSQNHKERENRIPNIIFKEQSAHYDYVSFDYNDTHIETNTNTYYLIGCNSNYYFVLDKGVKETLIIPKSECKNIKSHMFGLHSLLFFRK